ncbi:ribosome assembly RNA-binding protein YhbY [Nitrogeniibacter mangrovi]|uniref:Ribosome assembly RNA-binding protein YhbY n=1 Tax=Nitrogeniibacter mangrovi TaxID=2016596 RepID=A0A6C1B7E0_9RHOO|nr:ribosome assembly RNA-binding protein YhbY [Nitrogeniibacter mangrovi]QID18154.1 ribosome assembly RNA-binding protein YhbY [Nitrogeniibacter mangrovi]
MTELTSVQRRALRAQAHHLNPVVSVAGNGLSPAVVAEIDANLKAHELIKVRVYGEDRHQRDALMGEICEQTGAASVQHIGNILVLYREAPPTAPKPAKPAPRRTSTGKPMTAKRANR